MKQAIKEENELLKESLQRRGDTPPRVKYQTQRTKKL